MRYVLDASVALCWVIPRPLSAKALLLHCGPSDQDDLHFILSYDRRLLLGPRKHSVVKDQAGPRLAFTIAHIIIGKRKMGRSYMETSLSMSRGPFSFHS
jgi:hypothetical protein